MYIRAPRFDLLFHTTLVNLNTGHFHHIEVLVFDKSPLLLPIELLAEAKPKSFRVLKLTHTVNTSALRQLLQKTHRSTGRTAAVKL